MAALKWLIFVAAVIASYPMGCWLRRRSALRIHTWTLVALLPFFRSFDMGLIPWARPGDTHGIEVSLIDWLALTLNFAYRRPPRSTPYRMALAAYMLATIVAVTQAQWTLGALGYTWKLCRMYLLYLAISRAGHDERVPSALFRGLMLALVYEAALAVWQHFFLGVRQATGSFAHQNALGIIVNLVVMVPVALTMAGRVTTLTTAAVIAAGISCILTASRAAIFLFLAGVTIVYICSLAMSYTTRKAKLGALGLVVILAATPWVLDALASRSPKQYAASNELRWQYQRAASMMLEEHPLGVGPNHFTINLLARYGERAGVTWSQRVAIVHNIYWLTAAEMGYVGVVALIILFLAPLLSAIRHSFSARRDHRGHILLGLGAGLTVFYVHSFVEWMWRDTTVSYVYWIVVGTTASLALPPRRNGPTGLTGDRSGGQGQDRPGTATVSRHGAETVPTGQDGCDAIVLNATLGKTSVSTWPSERARRRRRRT